jgi:hypothetical protein
MRTPRIPPLAPQTSGWLALFLAGFRGLRSYCLKFGPIGAVQGVRPSTSRRIEYA